MSLLKIIRQQLGLSGTPTNNFTFDASAANGTMKLARGNAGATTQDILTVDAAGVVGLPQLPVVKGANGYITLPNGMILQWGNALTVAGSVTITWPKAFPTSLSTAVGCADTAGIVCVFNNGNNNAGTFYTHTSTTGNAASATVRWFAIGY